MKKVAAFVLLASFCVGLVGCETVAGFGRDIRNTGDNIGDLFRGADD